MKNLLTDIPGVRVGHAHDATIASGVTAVIFDKAVVASADVRGGGPGSGTAHYSNRSTQSKASMRSHSQADRLSGWKPAAACRRGLPNRAVALLWATP